MTKCEKRKNDKVEMQNAECGTQNTEHKMSKCETTEPDLTKGCLGLY
jgi:hypothetical protein